MEDLKISLTIDYLRDIVEVLKEDKFVELFSRVVYENMSLLLVHLYSGNVNEAPEEYSYITHKVIDYINSKITKRLTFLDIDRIDMVRDNSYDGDDSSIFNHRNIVLIKVEIVLKLNCDDYEPYEELGFEDGELVIPFEVGMMRM